MPLSLDPLVSLLLDSAAKGLIVLLAAALLSAAFKRASAALRHLAWAVALSSLIAMPALSLILPEWRLPVFNSSSIVATTVDGVDKADNSVIASATNGNRLDGPVSSSPATEFPGETTAASGRVSSTTKINQRASSSGTTGTTDFSNVSSTPASQFAENAAEGSLTSPRATTSFARAVSSLGLAWPAWLLMIWVAGAAVVLLRLLAGAVSVRRLARRARPVTEEPWAGLLAQTVSHLGVSRAVSLLKSDRVTMPITWGVMKPAILLPADANEWSDDRRHLILLHELAHVKRGDCLTQMIAQIACALHWFNPLIWLAARRLRLERERACDDEVLRTGARASDYADHLLDIARSLRSARVASVAAVAAARRSQLEGRLLAILDPRPRRAGLNRAASFSLCLVLAAIVLPLTAMRLTAAGQTPTPAAQVAPRQPVPAVIAQPPGIATTPVAITGWPSPPVAPLQAAPVFPLGEPSIAQPQLPVQTPQPAAPAALPAITIAPAATPTPAGEPIPVVVAPLQPGAAPTAATPATRPSAVAIPGSPVPAATPNPRVLPPGQPQSAAPTGPERSKIIAALREALKDSDRDVRAHALMVLARIADSSAGDVFKEALRDSDPRIRAQAAWGLGVNGDATAIDSLIHALKDADGHVRAQAAWALGVKGDTRAVEPLIAAAKDESAQVRAQVIWALALKGDSRAVNTFITALKDSSPQVRAQAGWALGMKGDDKAVDALIAALKDESAQVRAQAAWALGMRRSTRAAEALSAAMKDADPQVRRQAAWALGMLLVSGGENPRPARGRTVTNEKNKDNDNDNNFDVDVDLDLDVNVNPDVHVEISPIVVPKIEVNPRVKVKAATKVR